VLTIGVFGYKYLKAQASVPPSYITFVHPVTGERSFVHGQAITQYPEELWPQVIDIIVATGELPTPRELGSIPGNSYRDINGRDRDSCTDELLDRGEQGCNGDSGGNGGDDKADVAEREPKEGASNRDDGPPVVGDENYHVYDPGDVGREIAEIDEIRDGVLVEKKALDNVPVDIEAWIQKHIFTKVASYNAAKAILPGYEDASILFELSGQGASEALRARIDAAAASVDATVVWGS